MCPSAFAAKCRLSSAANFKASSDTLKCCCQPRVRKTLILPNVTRQRLQQVLDGNTGAKMTLCQCFGMTEDSDPTEACLCSDQVSDSVTPHDVNDAILRSLRGWWQVCLCDCGPDPAMDDDKYEQLIARFAGPATTVKVHCVVEPRIQLRTKGEAISEVGNRMTRFALYPDQILLMQTAGDLVFLNGPPGTGKTLMLVLKALKWLQDGLPVHVLSTIYESVAASHLVCHQLKNTAHESKTNNVHFLSVDLYTPEAITSTVDTLTKASQGGVLCIIADEAGGGDPFKTLCTELSQNPQIRDLRIWAASLELDSLPPCMSHFTLTTPLRCPPAVTREVEKAKMIQDNKVPGYSIPDSPLPCDGPEIQRLVHRPATHQDSAGRDPSPVDCQQCGMELAQLLYKLGVGQSGSTDIFTVPLNYRDVFVLSWYCEPHDDELDPLGQLKPANGIVQGLRRCGVPVRVVGTHDIEGRTKVAVMAGDDAVVVTDINNVWGLERKVVVWLGDTFSDDTFGRLQAMSRTTAQLIWIVKE